MASGPCGHTEWKRAAFRAADGTAAIAQLGPGVPVTARSCRVRSEEGSLAVASRAPSGHRAGYRSSSISAKPRWPCSDLIHGETNLEYVCRWRLGDAPPYQTGT